MIARQLLQLCKAYNMDEFCRHVLPLLVDNLAKDQVATVRQAAVEVVSWLVILYCHSSYLLLH